MPSELLAFSWLNQRYKQLELPDEEVKENFNEAYNGCQIGFQESLSRIVAYLKTHGIKVCDPSQKEKEIRPRYLNSRHIAHLLNSPEKNMVLLTAGEYHNKSEPVKGSLLVYALCQLYKCRIMLFSSRSHARIIYPNNHESVQNLPSFHILEHKDSYLGKTTYYSLKLYKSKPLQRKLTPLVRYHDPIVALKLKPGEAKPMKSRSKLGNALDERIVDLVTEEAEKYMKQSGDNSSNVKSTQKRKRRIY